MRYGMVIDLKRCIGCYGCQIFCKSENATPPGVQWSQVLFCESGNYPNVKLTPLPVLCMHCGSPACVNVCPTGASIRRPDGIVTISTAKCTGCGNCLLACPYGARHLCLKEKEYFPGQGPTPYEKISYRKGAGAVVGKCHFCLPRIKQGLEPACVQNCMAKARHFGDLDDPGSNVSTLIRERGVFQIHPCACVESAVRETEPEMAPSVYYLAP